jgi:hypothetical protein
VAALHFITEDIHNHSGSATGKLISFKNAGHTRFKITMQLSLVNLLTTADFKLLGYRISIRINSSRLQFINSMNVT